MVALMTGMGAKEQDIASVIGVCRNTLRNHYPDELATGRAKMDFHFYSALYKGIAKGKADLIKYYGDKVLKWKSDEEIMAPSAMRPAVVIDNIPNVPLPLPVIDVEPTET